MRGADGHAVALLAAALACALLAHGRQRRRGGGGAKTSACAGQHEVPRAAASTEICSHVRQTGVCVVEGVLDEEARRRFSEQLATIEPRKMQNRRKCRWEHVHSPEAPPFAELAAQPLIAAAVRAVLGPKHYLEKAGLLVSHPGAEAQRWHMDTPHLFTTGCAIPSVAAHASMRACGSRCVHMSISRSPSRTQGSPAGPLPFRLSTARRPRSEQRADGVPARYAHQGQPRAAAAPSARRVPSRLAGLL